MEEKVFELLDLNKMDSLIGDFFLKNGQSKAQHIEAVTGDSKLKAVLLYFGGSWAPPCKLSIIQACNSFLC